jgi:hypothetical protein
MVKSKMILGNYKNTNGIRTNMLQPYEAQIKELK